MSEIKVNSVVNSTGDNDSGLDLSTNDQVIIKTANTTAVTVDSSQGVTVAGAFTSRGIDDNADATAITINNSEHVGIGETSPLGTLHVRTSDASLTSVNGNADDLIIENNGNCGMTIASSTTGEGNINFVDSGDTNIGRIQYHHSDNRMVFRTNDVERMRITNEGRFGFNTSPDSNRVFHIASNQDDAFIQMIEMTETGAKFGLDIFTSGTANNDNNSEFFRCRDTGAVRFRVMSDGDCQNNDNSYGGISDVKLKEQITDASSQWEDIKALRVRKFKLKEDVANGDSDALWKLGVIAQEVETSGMSGLVKDNPDLVEDDDGFFVDSGTVTKSVKYSILYMKAVKALQEAMTRIETLETANTDLEARITALENAE